jgi:hypothetical protein
MAGLEKSVVLWENGDNCLEDNYVSTMPKTTPAGYKVVRARYLVEKVSVWIVPDNVDEGRLYCKWDELMYCDKDENYVGGIEFEKIVDRDQTENDAFKRPHELKICIPEKDELYNEDMFFDCEETEINEEMLKTAREVVSKIE